MVKNGRRTAKTMNWRAATGGLRSDVPVSDMPPDAAWRLDNFFPEAGYVRARYGTTSWATGLGASVKTLIPYSGATNKLFACAGSNIYEVTSSGAVGSALVTGLTNARLSTVQFTTSGGKFIMAVNGSDTPRLYNGTTWSTASITGPSSASVLSIVAAYRSRLYFIEKNSTKIWYLGTNAIAGAALSLEVGAVMKYGGVLVDLATWTMALNSGLMQYLVLISSQGEAIIYQGSDPADPTNWSLMGVFKLGRPLGTDRAMQSIGGDLAIMTVDGIVPISKAAVLDPAASDLASLTAPIAPMWLDLVAETGATAEGWQMITFPRRRMVVVNVPAPNATIQMVMNAETSKWCRFIGINANCWVAWNDNLYYGTPDGKVVQAETGASDDGRPIDCLYVGAFTRNRDGMARLYTSLIGVQGEVGLRSTVWAGVSTDYNVTVPQSVAVSGSGTNFAKWDSSVWDGAVWGGSYYFSSFSDAGAVGLCVAPTIRALISGSAADTSEARIFGGAMLYETGQPI